MTLDITNLALGPATIYHGAFSAPEPLDSQVNSTPASSAWTDLGGTQDGTTVNINQTYTELLVDQIVDSAGRRLTKRDVQVVTNMAEVVLDNLAIALNGGTVTTGATEETYDPDDDVSATQPDYSALLIDAWTTASRRRRLFVRKVLSTESVGVPYKKDAQTLFPVTFSAHYVSPSIKPFRLVDALS